MYLYVIGPADGPYKIGRSIDPASRVKVLQTGHAGRLSIWGTRAITHSSAETEAHARLAAYRRSGEWFDCGLQTILTTLEMDDRHLHSVTRGISAHSFKLWLQDMAAGRGMGRLCCARALGVSDTEMDKFCEYGATAPIALACRALLHRLEPYP